MMKATVMHKNGSPDEDLVLSVVDGIEVSPPAKGEILVKVHAAAINPIDYKLIKADVPGKKQGRVGFDFAGVVEAVGPGCSDAFKVGDAVFGDTAKRQGSFAEYVSVLEAAVCLKPEGTTFREAAAVPLAGLTAYQGLMGNGKGFTIEGSRVGILGGSGGVGSFAIQMAKALGAAFVITTSSNVEMVTSLGADEVINYREKDVVESMAGKDLDLVFDCVGGVESWHAAQRGLKKGGCFATIVGDSPVVSAGIIPGIVNRKFWSNFGAPNYRLFLTNSESNGDLNAIKKMIEEKKVKVLVDERKFTLTTESVHELFKAIMSHRTKGKLVLDVC